VWRARWRSACNAGWVPIRPLSPRHKPRVLAHFLGLSAHDRYLRFGYPATDEQMARYVQQLDFARDEMFGIFNGRLELVAVAHLACSMDAQHSACAEFGVSVTERYRGRALASRLFGRALMQARNRGVVLFFIHALSENEVMLKIARRAGARIERDGSESDAFLSLPEARLGTRLGALLEDQMAELDYSLKQQAREFRQWLDLAQQVRKGVREARHHASP
jgi:GNAT superfamily N-acetyltransferase